MFRELVRSRVADPGRLEAVVKTGLLDTSSEEPFDRIASLAARVLGTPWAFVTVVDQERSFWKACFGVDLGDRPRQNTIEDSFCQYVVGTDGPFMIPDARSDARTSDNPSIASMGVVAWAGHPIRNADGQVLGTVCVVDDRVRQWTESDGRVLEALAAIAGDQIRLRTSLDALDGSTSHLARLATEAARTEALLDTVVDRAPIGFGLVDRQQRYLLVNEALAEINGIPAEDHIGRRPRDIVPGVGAEVEAFLAEVLAGGAPVLDVEQIGETPAHPGVERAWIASYYRIETREEVVGAAVMVLEVTERRRAEQRLRRLIDGLFTFVALLTPEGNVTEVNRPALEAGGLTMDQVRGRPFWDTYWWSHDAEVQARLRESVRRTALGETVRYDVAVRVAGGGCIVIDFQLVPLVEGGEVTALVASGLDISERLAARRRSEGIAHLARRLTCAASTAEAAAVIASHGPAVLRASVARVGLVDRQRGVLRLVEPAEPSECEGLDRFREIPLETDTAVTETARTGELIVMNDRAERRRRYPHLAPDPIESGVEASASAPLLRSDGSVLGTLQFGWPEPLMGDDVPVAAIETVADLCAQTLDRTLQADASHDLVGTLQKELLAHTPSVPGLDIAVRYEPAARDLGFGGDWYDIVPLAGGRTAVIVGDVAGHGVAAAAHMAQVRTIMSTLVQLGDDLGGIFDRAGELLQRNARSLYATVSVTIIDPVASTLTVLSAGHPPPVVIHPDGRIHTVEPARRPLLGVAGPRLVPAPVPFPAGAVLLSFTDGLVERRDESLDRGLDRLQRQLVDLGGKPVEVVADEVLAGQLLPDHADDVALAVIRRHTTTD